MDLREILRQAQAEAEENLAVEDPVAVVAAVGISQANES